MIAMDMLTEQQTVPSASPVCEVIEDAVTEHDHRIANMDSNIGNGTSLSSDLASLATMAYSDLHLAWRRHYRSIPPKKISRDILELGIAWKIQESALGGLGAAVKRQVAVLARTMETGSDLAKARTVSCKPGARLLRHWEGVTHDVTVEEDAFLWAGKSWRSLSAIAREITGTRWSGPRFFGLTATKYPAAGAAMALVSDHE